MATALAFNPEQDAAPQLVAKGMGIVAENIISVAEEKNIPIYEDAKLSAQLQHLALGDQVPYELYEVVAEVLVFISSMDRQKHGKK